MRIALALLMTLHGIAHLVGFAVPWRLIAQSDTVYKTTILSGHADLGDVGIRALGILWLVTAIVFVLAAWSALAGSGSWIVLTLGVTLVSLVLSVLSWPDSRIGVTVNLVILVGLAVGVRFGLL